MRRSTAMLAGLLCAACGRHEEEPAPPPSLPHEGLNVLETGKGPLTPVRYHLVKGTHTPLEITADSQMHGQPKNPVLELELDLGIDDVLPDGSARVRIAVTKGGARGDAEAKPDLAASQAALLEGVAVIITLSPDGRVLSSQVEARPELSKQLTDKLQESVANLSLPLPSVPIGVGASWKYRKTLDIMGIKLIADTTYELTAINGDKLAIARKATFSGAAHTIEIQGTKLEIKSASGTLEGKSTLDLARFAMTDQATSHYKFEMVVTAPPDAEDPGGPSTLELDLTTTTAAPGAQPAAPTANDAGVDAQPSDAGLRDAGPVDAAPADAAKPRPKKKPKPKPKPDAGVEEPAGSDSPAGDPVP